MKSFLFTIFLVLVGGASRAIAYDPYLICESLSFDSERRECLRVVQGFRHFDGPATEVCREFSFSRDKLACLRNIGDKVYEPGALRICRRENLTSRRLQCLAENGRPFYDPFPPGSCLDSRELERELDRALIRLEDGDVGRTRIIIRRLLSRLRDCYPIQTKGNTSFVEE
jgi:hypothetical protein